MVKYFYLILLMSFAASRFSGAQDFSAQVNKRAVALNEYLHLKLELSDSQLRTPPDLSPLGNSFQIVGQQQSSVRKFINGSSSSSTVWDISLRPNRIGDVTIPSISASTDQGELKTTPIVVHVSGEATAASEAKNEKGISLSAKANKTEVYKNQPILVSFRLASQRPLSNVQIGDLAIKDAIVEHQGEPKIQREVLHGSEYQTMLITYLVTPLKDGTLTVPAMVIHAETPASPTRSSSRPSSLNSLFDDAEGGIFAEMKQMMDNFTKGDDSFINFGGMQALTLASRPVQIHVLPPVAGIDPWLPATSLKISESWSSEQLKVGDPVTRTISLDARGLVGSQLPGFESQLSSNEAYKVYSDQPEISTEHTSDEIIGHRKETFTIVPQTSGEVRFPSIKVTWWDSHTETQRVATLPEKSFHVSGVASQLAKTTVANPTDSPKLQTTPSTSDSYQVKKYLQLALLALLLISLFLAIYLIYDYLSKKSKKFIGSPLVTKTPQARIGPSDLEACTSISEIYRFLQRYAQNYWGTTANSSLANILAAANGRQDHFDIETAKDLFRKMEGVLYGNDKVDLKMLKSDLSRLIFRKHKLLPKRIFKKEFENLEELNPS